MAYTECRQREEVSGACQSEATLRSSECIVDSKCRCDAIDCKVSQAVSDEANLSLGESTRSGVCQLHEYRKCGCEMKEAKEAKAEAKERPMW